MRVAATPDELFAGGAEPRCHVARRFAFWAVDADLGGHMAWGHPDVDDAGAFVAVLERGLGERRPRRLVVDFRELVGFAPEAFDVLARYFARNRARVSFDGIVIRPAGALGALVSGFHDVVSGARHVPVVSSIDEACALLGRPDAAAAIAEVYRVRDARTLHDAVVDRVRAWLAERGGAGDLDAAARALGMSSRTLQRSLRVAGASFRDEQARARLVQAMRLLRDGGKLAVVALEVGFSTPQHFATWFKRATGMTPSEWQRRGGDDP